MLLVQVLGNAKGVFATGISIVVFGNPWTFSSIGAVNQPCCILLTRSLPMDHTCCNHLLSMQVMFFSLCGGNNDILV